MLHLIPKPVDIVLTEGGFHLSKSTGIQAEFSNAEIQSLANYLSAQILQAVGWRLDRHDHAGIQMELNDDQELGAEGYELLITADAIRLKAHQSTGLFYAIQTLLQMIPSSPVESVSLPGVSIRDVPRFVWRGAMLDVARHFFAVEDVQRYIDLISHYKINRLHLHLTDDQGWRIEIKSWPKLTEIGGQTQVGGNGGGFYTKEQYQEIVDYARSRYVMVVPEVDTPGHTNAVLASYAELSESEETSSLYEGSEAGFSSLSTNRAITYQFLADVIRELAELTPGPYIHIGGDEARATPLEEYKIFIKRIQEIVISHGKIPIGWAEIGDAELLPGTIAQHWQGATYQEASKQGAKIILSPANKTYLDMKYDASTPFGLTWAGFVSVKDSYDWEPGSYMHLLEEQDILGIEAPLWSETLRTMRDLEYLACPRLLCIAELAWSPRGQNWEEFRQRLAAHGKRMTAMEIHFHRSPDVDWS